MNLLSKNILADIASEIKQYSLTNNGKTPSYIIINDNDTKYLLSAMNKANLIRDNTEPNKITLLGVRVLRTNDIPKGYFDITGG